MSSYTRVNWKGKPADAQVVRLEPKDTAMSVVSSARYV